jgi:hypothetical protein
MLACKQNYQPPAKRNYLKSIKIILPSVVYAVLVACMVTTGCKEPFFPPETRDANNLLVIDGFLNAGNDSTIITLNHTRRLSDTVLSYPETGAQVQVLGESGQTFFLNEQAKGRYVSPFLGLGPGEKYQLQILTSDGKKYLSDFVPVVLTPPIDSISWRQDTTSASNKIGVTAYLTTHDPGNNTHYYQWKYRETWEYHAAYESSFLLNPDYTVVLRTPDQLTFKCYHDFNSTDLKLASSENLMKDLISEFPLVFIPQGDEKLGVRYRVFATQYGLTREAFDYWQAMRKNTELTGTIFAPLPSQPVGNYHCLTNPDEPVLGYLSAGTVQKQFIFILNTQTEHWGLISHGDCPLVIGCYCDPIFRGRGYVPIDQLNVGLYTASFPHCVDCTMEGGTTQKPVFW